MTDLRTFDAIDQQTQEQSVHQSPLMQKAAESAAEQQQQEPLSAELQMLLQNMQQERERVQVKQDMQRGAALKQIYGCGGCVKHADGGSIHIAPSKRGTFTAAASKHGMGVQAFASKVLANKENYSPAMVKKANFARNASKWHGYGGPLNEFRGGGAMSHQEGQIKNILDRYLSNYRITSAYRGPNNKVGKLGSKSAHAHLLDDGSSAALDIVSPDMDRLRAELANPALQKELAAAGFGILDETDPATMKRTGATGAHFHIGQGIKGGGFHLNGYGHQPAGASIDGQYPLGFASYSLNNETEDITPSAFTPWWANVNQAGEPMMAEPVAQRVLPTVNTDLFDLDWNPYSMYEQESTAGAASFPKLFAPGGYTDVASMIKAHEGFSPTAYKDGNSQSIGYGFYKHGLAQGIDFNKRMSRQEADAILDSNINKLKMQLRDVLGPELYNSLTPGQLMGYIDTGYQRPATMVKAAKIHKRTGDPNKAADALAVKGFAKRNADRRAAFLGDQGSMADLAISSPASAEAIAQYAMSSPYSAADTTTAQTTEFTPWWQMQRVLPYDGVPTAQQAATMAVIPSIDLGWDPVNGRHNATSLLS